MSITHAETLTGETNDAGFPISKTKWNDAHVGTNDHGHTATGDGGALGALGVLSEVTASLTSTQIKNLFSSPLTLVAGVASKVHWPVAATAVFRYGGTQYANVGTTIQIGAPAAMANFANPLSIDTGILAEIAEAIAFFQGSGPGTSWVLSDFEGQALKIFCSGSNPTTGNGTLDVWVLYRTITV